MPSDTGVGEPVDRASATRVLITGAAGFLARTVARIAPAHWSLVGLVRSRSSAAFPRYERIHDSLTTLPASDQLDCVLHLAASIPSKGVPVPTEMRDVNVGLVGDLIARYPSARHVLASSVSVYGTPVSLPLTVDSESVDPGPYGISKLDAERLIERVQHHAVLRFTSLIGTGMRADSFIPAAIAGARLGTIRVYGDGRRLQDYLAVEDAAAMCIQAAESTASFRALGVSGRSYSNLEVAELLAGFTGASVVFHGADDSPSFAYDIGGERHIGPAHRELPETLSEMVSA